VRVGSAVEVGALVVEGQQWESACW